MIWFAEQFTPSGRVVPVTFHGSKPTLTTPDGRRRLVLDRVSLIYPSDEGLPLDELQEIYGHPNARRVVRRVTG
jgi:hypothetical protein